MPKVQFGDVARECRENYKGDQTGMPVVGLEHLEPETMTLHAWGTSADNNFTKCFHKGQVLFGRRRAYLKKAVVAPFDGICSGDITVIEAKADILNPELLPFIVQNDDFFRFAVGHSAGSLSPRVKWEHLQNYEFTLPSMAEQDELVELLRAMERTKNAYKELIIKTDELVKSQFVEMFGDKQSGFKYPCSKVQELTDVCSGGTPDRNNAEYWEGGTIPWVKTTELQNNVINIVDEHITEKGLADSSAKLVPAGSILIAMYGQGKTRGMTAYLGIEASTNQACACILPTEKIDMVFMWQYFVNSYNELRNLAKGSNQANLNAGMIKSFPVPVPPIELQKQYSAFVAQADKSKFAAQQALADLTATQKALMRQYLG